MYTRYLVSRLSDLGTARLDDVVLRDMGNYKRSHNIQSRGNHNIQK
jgi:hypothetical protein